MTIERTIQQAGALSLPRGFQQPGRKVEIEIKDDNTLILHLMPVSGTSPSDGPKVSVNVYLICIKEGVKEQNVKAQFRAIDELGYVLGKWYATVAKYGAINFFEQGIDHIIATKKFPHYYVGKQPVFINAITDNVEIPELVKAKIKSILLKEQGEQNETKSE